MIGIVVVTHGRLGEELVNAAENIVGSMPLVAVVSLGWSDDVARSREAIAAAMEKVRGDGVLLLTDMFGGTPTNLSLSFLSKQVEIVTGVNLPMLIKMANSREESLSDLARMARDHGQKSIVMASELLQSAS
ncbi:MAG: PTS fructose transporter subunit IIA [Vicinamibacteria bacterium]|nr:PTS fructose transporter subunit IIA [Vicinamibacteria bacterium]